MKKQSSDPDIDAVDNVVTKVNNKNEVTTKNMRWLDEIRHYKMDKRSVDCTKSTLFSMTRNYI